MKPYWEITPEEAAACLEATHFCPADLGYFRGGGFSTEFETRGGMPVTMCAAEHGRRGSGPSCRSPKG